MFFWNSLAFNKLFTLNCTPNKGFLSGSVVKNPPTMQETQETRVWFAGSGRSPGEESGNHSSILAWKIPWTEEPGRLQSKGSQRVRHDWMKEQKQTERESAVSSYHFVNLYVIYFWNPLCLQSEVLCLSLPPYTRETQHKVQAPDVHVWFWLNN